MLDEILKRRRNVKIVNVEEPTYANVFRSRPVPLLGLNDREN